MATTTGYDQKATTERLSDDIKVAPTTLESGEIGGHRRLVAPPLVAAMSAEERADAEKRMRRKIDTRLLPMIILMYIMSELTLEGKKISLWDVKLIARRLPRQEQHRSRPSSRSPRRA
jgi:hypothetical protein